MNLQRFPLLLAAFSCLVGAQSPPAPSAPAPPPPGVEEALRERIRPFYQGYVDKKFRKTYDIAADDSKDAFITASKPPYEGFEILKIVFADDCTTARVTTEIHTNFNFFGHNAPEKTVLESSWKMVDGQWYWYVPAPSGPQYTPAQRALMGFLHYNSNAAKGPAPAAEGAPTSAPAALPPQMPQAMPAGFAPGMPQGNLPGGGPVSAAELLSRLESQVKLDKDHVVLRADQPGSAVVVLKNGMKGPAAIAISGGLPPGLTVTPDKLNVGAGDSANIKIDWKPPTPHAVPPRASFGVRLMPLGTVLPVTVTFQHGSSAAPPPAHTP